MIGFALLCGLFWGTADKNPEWKRYSFQQKQMGVSFRITLYAPDKAAANIASRAAFLRIERLNGILSDYDANSEVSRLCRSSRPGKPVQVSRDLMFVLAQSLAVSQRSNGAFDVTVGHLTRLWRRTRRRKQMPKPDDLQQALQKTGYRFVRLDAKNGTVELLNSGMRIDFGGIAKGYAADEAMKVLRKHGITRAMVDGGGDIVVGDPPPGRKGWKIGIAGVKNPNGKPSRYLLLKNVAVATSGDAYQSVTIAGKRYSHILDPRTGLGLTTRSSVTVIAPNGTAADSLASAVSVLGTKRGLELIKRLKRTEVLIVHLRNGQAVVATSPGFAGFERKPKK